MFVKHQQMSLCFLIVVPLGGFRSACQKIRHARDLQPCIADQPTMHISFTS